MLKHALLHLKMLEDFGATRRERRRRVNVNPELLLGNFAKP
jgi:hypothetical protein